MSLNSDSSPYSPTNTRPSLAGPPVDKTKETKEAAFAMAVAWQKLTKAEKDADAEDVKKVRKHPGKPLLTCEDSLTFMLNIDGLKDLRRRLEQGCC
jgi:hypothetical protein